MSSTKSFINTFMLAIATLAITACVPKATEKKAVCGTNQAFSTVSRSCYSIEELRSKPIGTTSTVSMSEETPKTITLTYTDGNKDKAISCRVSSISSNLEMIAPSVADGGLFDKADEVYQAASNIATQLVVSEVAMRNALLKAKASQYYPTVVAQLGVFKAQATALIALGAGSADVTIQYYYSLGQERMTVFTSMMTNMTNRCECTGGVCSTVAIPKLNKSGAAGFSYSVTDVDGEGGAKATAVTIAAMSTATAHLKPVAQSGFYNLNESSDSTLTPYSITIPDGNDLSGVNTSMRYYFNGTKNGSNQGVTTKGLVTGCMDLTGSTGLTDKTCIYTPTNGDAFDIITPVKAAVVIDDLTFSGVAEGTAANSFTVQYFDLNANNLSTDPYVSAPQIYGLVATADEAFIRVAGNAVKIFINPGVTTSTQIQTLVNAHKQASLMVKVTGATGLTPSPSLLTPTAVSLTGGVDSFDKIPFYVNNLQTSSVNTAYMMIKMNSVDDVPAMIYGGVESKATYLEDPTPSPIQVNLLNPNGANTYSDVDTDTSFPGPGYYNTCDIDPTDALFFSNFPLVGISCTCVLKVCTASITPNPDVSSTSAFTFRYRIGSIDTYTSTAKYTEYRTFFLTMTPVNDAPQISEVAIDNVTPIQDVQDQSMLEGATKYIDIWIGPGGSGFETSQAAGLTLTAASNNLTLLPAANVVVSDTSPVVAGKKRITFTPAAGQSGLATITLTLNDHGGVTNSGVEETIKTFDLTVTPVNDPPVFSTSITAIHTNEGGAVQSDAFVIDEDSGNTPDENYQTITIDTIDSDNTNVLPNSAIKLFYDLNDNGVEDIGEARVVGDVLEGPLPADAAIDAKLHKLYLKLDPVDGISGNANITLTISDHIVATDPKVGDPTYLPLTNQKTISFSLVVHPIAALHGGWNNISSVGIKTDKEGAPVSAADIACNYNLPTETNNCGTSSTCTGTTSPNGVKVPSAANTIYWDSANLRCYRSTGTTEYTWVDHNTSCPITRGRGTLTTLSTTLTSSSTTITVASTAGFRTSGVIVIDSEQIAYTGKTATTFTGLTRGANSTTAAAHTAGANIDITDYPFVKNLIADASPVTTAANQYYYTVEDKSCHQSYYNNTGALVWGASNYQPAKVTLAWKPFIMTGSGSDSSVQISGWNVYRRDAGTDFNFKGGHLKNSSSTTSYTITDPSVRTFTDTTAVAGRVYYYVVRPVDNLRLFPTYTPESFSEVRVVASPSNYSFVHRWIVNQEMCNGMNITTTTTPYHVDQTKNFRCEYTGPGSVLDSGVNYYDYGKDLLVDSQESGCAYAVAPKCTANGCVGLTAPTGYTASKDDLYYNRSTGACYINTSAVSGTSWTIYQSGTLNTAIVGKTNSALNAPLTNLTKAKAIATCNTRTVPVLSSTVAGVVTAFSPAVGLTQLPNKKDYMAYASQKINATDPEITEMEQGYSLNIQSRCNGSAASGLETAYTDSAIPSTSFIYSLPGSFSSGIRSLYTGSISWSSNKGTEACVSRFGIQDLYGNVAEWVDDGMSCDTASYRSKVCTVDYGGSSSFIEDEYGTDRQYTFDNIIGPYNEGGDSIVTYPSAILDGSILAGATSVVVDDSTVFPATGILVIGSEQMSYTSNDGTTLTGITRGVNSTTAAAHTDGDLVTIVRSDDSYLTNWTFGDQFFGASYFNYPLGLPLSSNFNQATFSAYLDWALSIGPSSGITTNKLHEDGIIVNGSEGAVKSFAVGGSYLSGNRAGRFSSELIDNSVSNRPDVGFRCIVPIVNTDYPVDANHNYGY